LSKDTKHELIAKGEQYLSASPARIQRSSKSETDDEKQRFQHFVSYSFSTPY